MGYVVDQAGNPVSGVRIVATSPTQIGGQKVTYTGADGSFNVRGLIPGTFEVRASAPNMAVLVQKDVTVGITSAAELNLMMEVKTTQEEVTVVQKAPVVSTTKPNVTEDYSSEFVEALPHHTRDNIHRDMLGSVAGAVGNRMRGGGANQTLVTQDGFDMGVPGRVISPAFKSTAAFEIQTAGYGADNPTAPGGMLNLVTRSGSNKFEFEFNATADADQLRFFRDSVDTRADTFYYVLNPTIAGPIIKDKLWFFVNPEFHFTQDGRQPDPLGEFPDPVPVQRIIPKGNLKLTWQATTRNKLALTMSYELPFEHNRVAGVGIDATAQEDRKTQRIFLGAIWDSILRDDLIFSSRVGLINIPEHVYPALCRTDPDTCNHIPAETQTFPRTQRWGNSNNAHTRTDLYSLQLINMLEYFMPMRVLGEHSFQIKSRYFTEKDVRKSSRPGDMLTEYNGTAGGIPVPLARTTYYSNDPRLEQGRFGWFVGTHTASKNIVTLADTWRPTRHLTITPSVSHVWAKGGNSNGEQVMNAQTWAPGLAAIWDATHDGRTAVRSSLSSYVDLDVGSISRHTIGGQTAVRCLWNEPTSAFDRDCVYSGGYSRNTIGLPCGPTGLDDQGQPCQQKLKVPRTLEMTAGAEREIVTGIALSLDFVHRQFNNQYEVNETNRIWTSTGNRLYQFGGYRNGRPETINDLGTPDGAQRRYDGATIGVNKREGRVKANLTYTLAYLTGTVFNGFNNAFGDVPPRDVFLDGFLPDDHRHEIKATLAYQATPWLSFGTRTIYLSGQPYDRLFRSDVTNGYEVYRAERGNTAGGNLNDPADDRQLRLPDQMEVNVQARVNFMPLIGQQLDFYVDVLNALALRTVTGVNNQDGPAFGTSTGVMDPFRVRLGINYKF
jgi:hypothetical protein